MTLESLRFQELESETWLPTSDEKAIQRVLAAEPIEDRSPNASVEHLRSFRPFVKPCCYYAISRLAVLFAALASKWFDPRLSPMKVLTAGWDGTWYLLIAQHGYPQRIFNEGGGSRWAFFPAYPATIRATVAATGLSYAHAIFLLTLVLGLTSTLALWLAIREIFGPKVADRSALLYVFFPASYVLSMAYTEALFVTAAAACLFAISRRYWITAGLFAGLASLTRSFGAVLVLCVFVAAIQEFRRNRRIRPLAGLFIAPLGFIGWLTYSQIRVGNAFAFLSSERIWRDSHFVWFRTPLVAVAGILDGGTRTWSDGQMVLAAAAVCFVGLGIYYLIRAKKSGVNLPAFWWIFLVGSVLGMMSPENPVSILRYSLPILPIFAAYAWRMRQDWEGPIVGLMAFCQGSLALVVFVGSLHPHTSMIWP